MAQNEDVGSQEVRLHGEHGDQRQNHQHRHDGSQSTGFRAPNKSGEREHPLARAKITLSAVEFSRPQLSNPLHDCASGSGGAHQPRQKLMLNH